MIAPIAIRLAWDWNWQMVIAVTLAFLWEKKPPKGAVCRWWCQLSRATLLGSLWPRFERGGLELGRSRQITYFSLHLAQGFVVVNARAAWVMVGAASFLALGTGGCNTLHAWGWIAPFQQGMIEVFRTKVACLMVYLMGIN